MSHDTLAEQAKLEQFIETLKRRGWGEFVAFFAACMAGASDLEAIASLDGRDVADMTVGDVVVHLDADLSELAEDPQMFMAAANEFLTAFVRGDGRPPTD